MKYSLSFTPKFRQCGKMDKTAKTYVTHKKISVFGFKSEGRFKL